MDNNQHGSLPSERSFGLLFTAVLLALAIYGYFHAWKQAALISCVAGSALFAIFTLIAPGKLAPLNKAWYWLGQTMGRIINPLFLGLIFFVLLTPIAIIMRLFKRDELRMRSDKRSSYWIVRDPSGPASDSFKNQF
ncbi:SxtJ family membrane protein [Undibacterium sp. JH2W]|uniref:SxtJ family membrane protein n=1 Tax=Undibacterium sp. JH2W TaxID=3413037 RepID=UPI003BF08F42